MNTKKIRATQEIEVSLTESVAREVCLDFLYDLFQWQRGYFLEQYDDGVYICEEDTFYSSHSFSQKRKIRIANANDLAFERVLKKIHSR
jgi:hypothetical protein